MEERIIKLLAVLPPALSLELRRMRDAYPALFSRMGELRLRAGRLASISLDGRQISLPVRVEADDLADVFRRMCGESVYAQESSLREGYLSFAGMRVGIAGRAVREEERVVGVSSPSSLCIRISHRVRGAGEEARRLFLSHGAREGMLVYSPPGVGKTTLLSDLAILLATDTPPREVALIDTRGELYDEECAPSAHIDRLLFYPIAKGILHATRALCPDVIICDELGTDEEADAVLSVAGCGVPVIASTHAGDEAELCRRAPIKRLLDAGIFSILLGISRHTGEYHYRIGEWGREGKECSALQAPSF